MLCSAAEARSARSRPSRPSCLRMSSDPYCYPGTTVLRNKFDIQNEEDLKATEARVAAVALFALVDDPLQGSINENRLLATHRAIFEELYDWAGTYRKDVGTMTKGREVGYQVTYGNSQFVSGEMRRVFAELEAEDFLRGLDSEQFASRLAYFYS